MLAGLVILLALSINLGRHPLLDPDEGRNAEVGREMMVSGDYLVPRLNALPYLDKPTLQFAAEAAAMRLFGATATAARLPSLIFTLATIALVGWFAERKVAPGTGPIAAIALASCPLVVAFSRIVIFDAALSFFVTLATLSFYLAMESEEHRRGWSAAGWLAIALGIVTKGPVALLLPLLVAIPYGIWRKRARAIWSWLGLLLFLAVVVPWIWAMSVAVPGFLEYALVTETMKRLATNELKRTGPPWYFIPLMLGGALPWILLLSGVRKDEREGGRWSRVAIYAFLSVLLPFVFFSISKSKRPQYILPLMPGVAILVAWHWGRLRSFSAERLRGAGVTLLVYGVLGAALLGAIGGSLVQVKNIQEEHRSSALILGVILVACAVAGAMYSRREVVFAALAIPMLAIPLAAGPAMDVVANRRSSEQLASQLRARHSRRVIAVRAYSGSLSFYLQQPLTLYTADASELTSNYLLRNYDKWIAAPNSTLRRPDGLQKELATCSDGTMFVTEPREKEVRSEIAARLPLAATGNRLEAFGPCHEVAVAEAQR